MRIVPESKLRRQKPVSGIYSRSVRIRYVGGQADQDSLGSFLCLMLTSLKLVSASIGLGYFSQPSFNALLPLRSGRQAQFTSGTYPYPRLKMTNRHVACCTTTSFCSYRRIKFLQAGLRWQAALNSFNAEILRARTENSSLS